jgi:hypothetical protein
MKLGLLAVHIFLLGSIEQKQIYRKGGINIHGIQALLLGC